MHSIEYGLPTLDRPFGLALWPIVEQVWTAVIGSSPAEFEFSGKAGTPMATTLQTTVVLAIYYVVIFGGREWMRDRPAYKLNGLFKVHNALLTICSGLLLALFLEQLIPTIVRHGLFFAICDRDGGWTKPLVALYYLNYLTKYWELLDTVFLFLKKKPLTFLHTYHHGATALLCFIQLRGATAVSWVVITLNLGVHVIMYFYYFQAARGIKIWWKKYITTFQICQFIIDVGFIYFANYHYLANRAGGSHWLPSVGQCAGNSSAGLFGVAVITSYLFLFIAFYISTYRKPSHSGGLDRATKALIEMKDEQVPDAKEVSRRLSGTSAGGFSTAQEFGELGRGTYAAWPRKVFEADEAAEPMA